MLRILLHRLIVGVIRLGAASMALLVLIELSFCVIGGSDRHVWLPGSYGPVPAELSNHQLSWGGLVRERMRATLPVLFLCISGIFLVGYNWGVLGARLRRFHAPRILSAVFSFLACVPAFWFVVIVAIYSYFHWQRPGFANDVVVEQGPDLLSWWNAAVLALPAMAAAVAWQIRAVSGVLEKEVAHPYVRGLFLSGFSDEDIFYRNAFRRSLPSLVALSDRTFPSLMGGLICLEYAFRYPGIGSLLVESVLLQSYGGIIASSLWMMSWVSLLVWIRECAIRFLKPDWNR